MNPALGLPCGRLRGPRSCPWLCGLPLPVETVHCSVMTTLVCGGRRVGGRGGENAGAGGTFGGDTSGHCLHCSDSVTGVYKCPSCPAVLSKYVQAVVPQQYVTDAVSRCRFLLAFCSLGNCSSPCGHKKLYRDVLCPLAPAPSVVTSCQSAGRHCHQDTDTETPPAHPEPVQRPTGMWVSVVQSCHTARGRTISLLAPSLPGHPHR